MDNKIIFKPNYTITNTILNTVAHIDTLNEYIANADILPVGETIKTYG